LGMGLELMGIIHWFLLLELMKSPMLTSLPYSVQRL
jgi:hypothetical protein